MPRGTHPRLPSYPHPAQIIATEPSLPEFSLLRLNTARLPYVYAEYGAVWDRHALLKVRTVPARARHPHNTPCLLAGIRPVYVTVVPLKPPHSSAYPLFLPAAVPACHHHCSSACLLTHQHTPYSCLQLDRLAKSPGGGGMARGAAGAGSRRNSVADSDEASAASLQGGRSSGNLRSLLLQGGGTSDGLPRSIRPMLHRFNLDAVERGASGGRIGDVVPSITIGSLLQR